MVIKTGLIEVKDRGWLNGFEPLWHKENHSWWGTRSWLVKILIWVVIIDGLLATLVFATPKIDRANLEQEVSLAESGQVVQPKEQSTMMIYIIVAGIIPASALIIFGHENLIDERKLGTAAWMLSKPVSRAAFLLSKFIADALGVLATMVVVQGLVAYIIFKTATEVDLSISGYLGGLGLIYLFLIFYLALILMLSTLFQSRGPVIGIPLIFLCCSYPAVLVPGVGQFMPSALLLGLETGKPSLAEALIQGQTLATITPILTTCILIGVFLIVAIFRFDQEEF